MSKSDLIDEEKESIEEEEEKSKKKSTKVVEKEDDDDKTVKESTEPVEKEDKETEADVIVEEKVEKDEEKPIHQHNKPDTSLSDDYLLEEFYRRKEQNKEKGREKSKSPSLFKLFVTIVISFVLGGIVMLSLIKFTPLVGEAIGSTGNTVVTKNKTQVYEKGSLAPAVEKIYDAVVLIQCYQHDELASSGTGFVYKTDDKYGYILTNAHVIAEMEDVKVTFTDEEEADVKVLGHDSYLDLAVLQVEKKYVSLVANIGSSEDVKLGDTVFTVGSPMGYDYRGSVTSGVLSGKDRMVSVSVSSSSNDWVMRVLQIDASINPGNSGGPLLNINGEVIGICSMKLVDSDIEGMGFAIPIEYAMNHVESLENGKEIEWPVLGISMANIVDTALLYRNNIRVPDEVTEGVVVIEATKDEAAEKAGLKKGDVIIKLGDKKVKDIAYLRYELYQYTAGDEIEITYLRDGKENKVKVTLGKSSD